MKNKAKKKVRICISIIIVQLLILSCVLIYPMYYEKHCKNRVYEDMNVSEDIYKANIRITANYIEKSGNAEAFSYSGIASGVIFKKIENVYYALTAYHVVNKSGEDFGGHLGEKNIKEVIHYIVLPYGTPTYEEAKRKSTSHVSPEDIYEKCPKATVEYYDESKDLAIISFTTDEELSCLEISDGKLEKGDKIVTIGNIEEKSFVLSYGKILSNDLKEFHPDEQAPNKVLYHNAYEEPGCSGAACLNKEMKIVGINIGGNTDLLGRFKSGVMIPNTQILELIDTWELME